MRPRSSPRVALAGSAARSFRTTMGRMGVRNPDRAQWRGVRRRRSNSRVGGRRDGGDETDMDSAASREGVCRRFL